MKKNKKRKAFSFIELIVVITIIAVLSLAAIVSYGPIQKKSRDSRRVADLQKISMALEMARQIGTTYPSEANLNTVLVPNYIQLFPKDPKTNSDYVYSRPTNYTFSIGASMEDLGSTNIPASGGLNYKVFNP